MCADSSDPVARFTSAEVCKAARISAETLKNWVSRKPAIVLLNEKDQAGGTRGVPNFFSLNRVLQIAIMADLVRLGWNVRPAAWAAIAFTDIGETVGGWVGDPPPALGRMPGQLFADGETLLIARPPASGQERPFAEVVNVAPTTSWADIKQQFAADIFGPNGATVLSLSDIMFRVRMALGLPSVP